MIDDVMNFYTEYRVIDEVSRCVQSTLYRYVLITNLNYPRLTRVINTVRY